MAAWVLTGAGRLVTCAASDGTLGVVEHGALAARDGEIVWVGREADLPPALREGATEVDAGGRAVLPGLVDCHTHSIFAGDRREEFAARARGQTYSAGGVLTTVEATRAATDDALRKDAEARLANFRSHGVTTVEVKTGYGLSVEQELRLLRIAASLPGVVPTYLAAHVPPPDADRDDYVDQVCASMPEARAEGAAFADVWCDRGAFTADESARVLEAASRAGLGVKIHAEQLAPGEGAALASRYGAVSADHLEHATPAGAAAMAAAGTVGVLLPGAWTMTAGSLPDARMLIDAGMRVAISTDFNPGSSPTQNLPLMAALARAQLRLTPEEAIAGITRNAAAALGLQGRVGSLEPGARADVLILDTDHEIDLVYRLGADLTSEVIVGEP